MVRSHSLNVARAAQAHRLRHSLWWKRGRFELTHLGEKIRHGLSKGRPGTVPSKTFERLYMATLAVLSIAWLSFLGWCAYEIALLAF